MWRGSEVVRRGFLLVMLAGSALITYASLGYFDSETLTPFVIEKLPVVKFEAVWLAALKAHVLSALITLPLCVLLMTRFVQRRRTWHRWLGRVTGAGLLFVLIPSGVVLAFEAKGGMLVTVGFLLSGAIVLWATLYGVAAARRGDLRQHSRAMRHLVAQMSVAVSSRLLMIALDAVAVDPEVAYAAALWGPVVGSAVIAEWVSQRGLIGHTHHIFERVARYV